MKQFALAIAFAALVAPGVSRAATVTQHAPPCTGEQSKYAQCSPSEAHFAAAPGERNDLTITAGSDAATHLPYITFQDTAAAITTDQGCHQVDEHTVTCAAYAIIASA